MSESKYEDLVKNKQGADYRNEIYLRKLHLLEFENDSLKTQLNVLKQEIQEKHGFSTSPKVNLSQDQKEIQTMILAMNNSWVKMHETRKPKEILKYFLPRFLVSQISVEIDNSANAAMYNPENFRVFLQDINSQHEIALEFGDVDFYDIEVKSERYFNAAFKCKLKVYKKDILIHNNSALVTISGRRVSKKWKIATYSWIGFKYELSEDKKGDKNE